MINLPGEIVHGGCEVMINLTSELLRSRNHEVVVIDHQSDLPELHLDSIRNDEARAAKSLRSHLHQWRPDIIHIHNLGSRIILQQLVSLPSTVRTLHDASLCCPKGKLLRPNGTICDRFTCFTSCRCWQTPRQWLRFQRYRRLLLQIPCLVPSTFMESAYKRAGFCNLSVLPHFFSSTREVNITWAPLVLFVGRLQKEKGIEDIIELTRQLPAHIHVAISGDGDERPLVKAAVQELAPRLEWDNAATGTRRHELLCKANCVVVPSHQPESFGLVGFLAAQYGKPTIAYPAGGVREWLSPECSIKVGDIKGLAAKITAFINSPQTAAQSGAQAFNRFQSSFSKSAYYQKLITFYQQTRKASNE